MSLGMDPNAILGRFLDKQQRQEQFSEDMRKVMYNGPGASSSGAPARGAAGSGGRARSPGLAAGAALALGGVPASASEAHAEARNQCRQAIENARRPTCPFDDHSAFGACAADRAAPVRMPTHEHTEVVEATKAARNLGKYNRDIAQKIGAGAPFDAPETDIFAPSSGSVAAGHGAAGRRGHMPPAMPPSFTEAVTGARSEAAANKTRMQGCQDLLGGYENPWEKGGQHQARRTGNSPQAAPHENLLPQAMMKLQYDGGSVKNLTCARSEYLNAKVLAEANRERNTAERIFG